MKKIIKIIKFPFPKEKTINFASVRNKISSPDFLDIQIKSFTNFFCINSSYKKISNKGFYKVFIEYFPISDAKNKLIIDFISYKIYDPIYSIEECLKRGLTYNVYIRARFKIYRTRKRKVTRENKRTKFFETIYQDVYFGTCPYMTPSGSFIFNGSERVIVSQLHRSPGVFFGQYDIPNLKKISYARIIPLIGAWIELSTDINNVMYIYLDIKKRLPITTLLRALGYTRDIDILNIFNIAEEVNINKVNYKNFLGRTLAARIFKTSSEKVDILLERDIKLKKYHIDIILSYKIKVISLYKKNENNFYYSIIHNTLKKDPTNSQKEANIYIYKELKDSFPKNDKKAKLFINKFFFSETNLGEVGRYRLNKTLKLDFPLKNKILNIEDIISIIENLIALCNNKKEVDDIDNLANRRVKTVGEQLYTQYTIGIARVSRIIKERINVKDNETLTPIELINSKTLTSVINSFFGTDELSQFMDQTNPLAEMTHKRRISSLGPGGLSRERAGFEIRDVNYSHYGRLCPIETPEGPNIGLISSLCVFARINSMGFIETPYFKVKKGKVVINEAPIYISSDQEYGKFITQANAILNYKTGVLKNNIIVRVNADFPMVNYKKINYIDVSTNQIASISASLIPFLEHDDANRALMGSNMMRQAVPLLNPKAPIVETGLEKHLAQYVNALIYAEGDGIVESVDANNIKVKYFNSEKEKLLSFEKRRKTYKLIKFRKTNQNTCINIRPIVKKGMYVTKGQVLCEGFATKNGKLALGRNIKVAFMPFRGYNFEDAIVISEKVVREDWFTSIHIDEYSLEVRETKLGMEEFTFDIPNINDENKKKLDKDGIIKIGSEVKPGDVLIGRITPKKEGYPSSEENFLKAIFGKKVGTIKNTSLKADSSLFGVVIDTKIYSKEYEQKQFKIKKLKIKELNNQFIQNLKILRKLLINKLILVLEGSVSEGILNSSYKEIIPKGKIFNKLNIKKLLKNKEIIYQNWVNNKYKNNLVFKIIKLYYLKINELKMKLKRKKNRLLIGDEMTSGIIKIAKVLIAKKRKLKVGDKMSGRHGNKGIVARIVKEEDMPYLEDGTSVDLVLNPLGVPSRMNLGQIYETILGWAGEKLGINFSTPIFDGASIEEISKYTDIANLPLFGNTYLFDGETGEKFYQPVTVGVIYMLKLNHMVDDKMHARSIGPYSLITQQPLGGKSKFGGQRLGEMEVWALEAFGAANILREILTVKSDDVKGRTKTYEAIVKRETIPNPGIPESFHVLLKELKGLGLSLKLEVIKKKEKKNQKIKVRIEIKEKDIIKYKKKVKEIKLKKLKEKLSNKTK
ncbi:DNA-directed RNA polymerase subunit beta [Candidatus Karelsulcia muelleri]|uniref:DNA-directed RNA polymerase subunit beta n=1 Tax=Candidatus Karelsulcia muelleri TaxID=336810 RepID=UPI000B925875|nr:DNA-directed RNA polymerase subunit beta [Candidatus Karelsulcia muelleri]ASS46852.1 DNA-directed RNA polymerase subunit beta [Candidatus Karelsulcia muelleri]